MKEGYSAKAASQAAYIAELGYQASRGKLFNTDWTSYGPTDNRVRMDMSLAAAGTEFAETRLTGDTSKPLQINQAYASMLKESMPMFEGKGDISWMLHFSPRTALSYFQSTAE